MKRLAVFYSLSIAFSWAVWAQLVLYRLGFGPDMPSALHLIGSLGPAVAAIATASLFGEAGPLLRRCDPRRLSLPSLLFALGLPLGAGAAGLFAQVLVGEGPVRWGAIFVSEEFPALSPFALVATSLLFYGFGEEIGWRGYLLPTLVSRMSVFAAAAWSTLPWAIWHLPLLLSSPTYRSLGLMGLAGWLASLAAGSFLLTCLFLTARRSIVAVALFHAALDLVMVNGATTGLGLTVMGAIITFAGVVAAGWCWRESGNPKGQRTEVPAAAPGRAFGDHGRL